MGFIRKNLLKVVEWAEAGSNEMVYKFVCPDRYEIMQGSQLIVRESQAAIFVHEGQIADVFTAGRWDLETKNLPILSKIASWKYDFVMPRKCDIYFVNLKQFVGLKWGTANPIMMRDKDFGMIRVSGHGEYSFHVCNPEIFMKECFGTVHSYTTYEITSYLKSIILMEITDLMGECEIPALELAANYRELGDTARDKACEKFGKLGLAVDEVIVKNLKLPEAVEQAMDKRTTLGVLGDKMPEYAQYEAVGAMRDAAKNPGAGGTFASMGVGLGAGARVGAGFVANIDGAMKPAENKIKCAKCGKEILASSKFCPECGEKVVAAGSAVCPKCGATVKDGSKFCTECGQSLTSKCSKCGADVKAGTKFCPECGAKIK